MRTSFNAAAMMDMMMRMQMSICAFPKKRFDFCHVLRIGILTTVRLEASASGLIF